VLQVIAEGVSEMIGNALEHSGSDALIMGQVYRLARGGRPPDHDDRIQVVIGDTGRGIRESSWPAALTRRRQIARPSRSR